MQKIFSVYILASQRNGTLYIGVTNNLKRRIWEHKNKKIDGFSKQYNINLLVYHEETENIHSALAREKHLKKWRREKKITLIEKINPEWKDPYTTLI